MAQTADFEYDDYWSIGSLTPLTPDGAAWAEENIEIPDYQQGSQIVHVEARYVEDILRGILSSGLTICSGDTWIIQDSEGGLCAAWSLPEPEVPA